VASK
jgi:hypothetical protein